MNSLAAKFHRVHDRARPIVGTLLYGLVASLAAVAFQLAINWLHVLWFKNPAATGVWHFLWISFAVMMSSSLAVGGLLRIAPTAAGSGIPQVKLAFWKEFGHAPRRIAAVKFVEGVLNIGGGQSLGREGPTVQIGSNLASSLAGLLGVSKQNRAPRALPGLRPDWRPRSMLRSPP